MQYNVSVLPVASFYTMIVTIFYQKLAPYK